jgi:WD40 repeat protein
MYRIFISHSSAELREGQALKQWLVQQDPPLANEIFLDADMMRAGLQWKDQLKRAMKNCEAVVCLTSTSWAARPECLAEFRAAEYLNKRIFCVRLEPSAGDEVTEDWQRVDMFGGRERTEISLPDDAGTITFSSEGLQKLKEEIVRKGIGPDSFVWPPPEEPDRGPYRGWEPLEEVDAAVYFGRDAQLVRAMDKLRGMRRSGEESLFVILGPSGSGKSSFLRAGLLPRLRRLDRDFVVLDRVVRPETCILTGKNGLAESIYATRAKFGLSEPILADIQQACRTDSDRVRQLLLEIQEAAARPGSGEADAEVLPTLVIPVDQAEELFNDDGVEEAPRFLELLALHSRADVARQLSLIVAMTIRTDRHQALQTAKQLADTKTVVFDDLKPMPQGQFREVIEGPARRATDGGSPLEIRADLVDQLLVDCTEGADTLPLLALTLARLFKEYGGDGDLTLGEYRQMGGLHDIVQTEVDRILAHDPKKRSTRLTLLKPAFVPWLATFDRSSGLPVRRVARWEDLPVDALDLVQQFVDRRLLMKDTRNGGDVVEVALESLLRQWKELATWLEEERGDLKMADTLQQSADEWKENGRNRDYLLKGKRLAHAERLINRPDYRELLAQTESFVEESKTQDHRRRATSLALKAAIAVAVIAAILGVSLYYSEQDKGEALEKQNAGWRLVSEADQILKGSRSGGDVQALHKLLAAQSLGAAGTEAVANTRRDEMKIFENPAGDGASGVIPVRSLAVDTIGRQIATANDDHTVRIWNMNTGQMREIEVGGDEPPAAVAMSPDGAWLAVGSGAKALQRWNAETGERSGQAIAVGSRVLGAAFSGGGERIAIAGDDGNVSVWNAMTGSQLGSMPAGPDAALSVAIDQGGNVVVSGGNDGAVRLWDLRGSSEISWRPTTPDAPPVRHVALDRDGSRVAAAFGDGSIRILDGRTLQPLTTREDAHAYAVNSVTFTTNGARLVSGGADNTVRVWDAATLAEVSDPLIGNHGGVSAVAVTADGTRIVSGGLDGSVRVWDAVSGLPIPTNQGEVRSVAFSPTSGVMASAGTDGTIKLWEAGTASFLKQLGTPGRDGGGSINAMVFSRDGSRIVTGSMDGSVRIWLLDKSEPIAVLAPFAPIGAVSDGKPRVQGVAISPDGEFVAAAGMDGTVRVWATDDFTALAAEIAVTADAHGQRQPYQIWSLAFAPDGRHLVTGAGGGRNMIQIWALHPDAQPGARLTPDGSPLIGHDGDVYSVVYNPDGTRIVSGGADGSARIWDVERHEQIGDPLAVGQNPLLSVAVAHDRPWLAVGSDDGKVRLWDIGVSPPKPIATPFEGHNNWVYSVAFSSDDSRILSGSRDGTIHLWPAPDDLTAVLCRKLTTNMTDDQWRQWISDKSSIRPTKLCLDLPDAGQTT